MEGFNTKCLTSLLQSYQGLGHSKQEKSEKLSLSGGAEKNLKSEYNVVFGSHSGGETWHQ